jgi:hypothetical protein
MTIFKFRGIRDGVFEITGTGIRHELQGIDLGIENLIIDGIEFSGTIMFLDI